MAPQPPELHRPASYRVSEGQVSSYLEGEVVILDLEGGRYYGLDGVGSLVWDLLQQPRTLDELQEAVMTAYAVDPTACRHDLEEFLDDLCARGIVELDEDAA